MAAREKLSVIDLHTATGNALLAAKKAQADYTFEEDAVHPGPDGQGVMAAEIVHAWGAPEQGIVITRKLTNDPTTILSVSAPVPWPAPVISERIRKAFPLLETIGAVTLKVNDLPEGNYELSVDGNAAGVFSEEDLEKGISIDKLSEHGPKASSDLAKAMRDKEDVEYMRWRDVQLRFAKLKTTANASLALDALAREANAVARTKAQPLRYKIKLEKVVSIKEKDKDEKDEK
jgi:hypothetical protein